MLKKHIDSALLKKMMLSGANCLENNKETVNSLNVFPVPDGDTGTNMSLTMASAVKEISNIKNDKLSSISDAVANGSLMGARGNSGVILSQIFRGFAKALKQAEKIDCKLLAQAFQEGSITAYKAVMKPTEGTILTVIRESADFAMKCAEEETDLEEFLNKVIESANKTLAKTPDILPVLKQAGVVDAGGAGLICIFEGMRYALLNDEVIAKQDTSIVAEPVFESAYVDLGEIQFGYCTEFFIKGQNIAYENFKSAIAELGDSIVVVGDESLVKTHVHTNNPGQILEMAMKLGELSKIKIDNMREQHSQLIETVDTMKEIMKPSTPEKEYGFVAVAMGEGISKIFKQLGVDVIIEGGQTMNPSTEDIIKSINKINAKNIIVFPNNSNVILAANQAQSISEKNVFVAPTKTIPQGIASVMSVEFNRTVEDNIKKVQKAIASVKTGLVTYAVRDSVYEDKEIVEGNILGLKEGKITKVGTNISAIAKDIIEDMIDEEDSLITIYYGSEMEAVEAEALAKEIEEHFEDCEVEIHYGGQPLYYYVISVE